MICSLAPTFIRLPEASLHGLALQFASRTHHLSDKASFELHHPTDKASFELHQPTIRSIRSPNPLTAHPTNSPPNAQTLS